MLTSQRTQRHSGPEIRMSNLTPRIQSAKNGTLAKNPNAPMAQMSKGQKACLYEGQRVERSNDPNVLRRNYPNYPKDPTVRRSKVPKGPTARRPDVQRPKSPSIQNARRSNGSIVQWSTGPKGQIDQTPEWLRARRFTSPRGSKVGRAKCTSVKGFNGPTI